MSIRVQHLSKTYSSQKVVDAISFHIKTGEVVGFLGPNGAGKSTTMKMLTGFIRASEGEAYINEQPVRENDQQVKKETGYLPEHNPLYPEMYVREYLQFCTRIHKTDRHRIEEIIQLTGLQEEAHKKIGQLSKGYRQRVGLAAALIHDPKVLILDEPTTGLDPNQLVEIRKLIKEVGKTKTVLLSTHIMQEVEAVCDRVIIIHKGKIAADKNLAALRREKEQVVQVEFDGQVADPVFRKIPDLVAAAHMAGSYSYELTFGTDEDRRPAVFDFAQAHGLKILQLSQKLKNLEELFRDLTATSGN